MSRVDYCNAMLAEAPKYITNKLQQVLNAAARIVTGTSKYHRSLSHLLQAELHWLTFHNECSTNSSPPFTGVCRTKHLNIWWTAALLPQTLPVVNICDQPTATSCSCRDTDVRCSAVGPSLLLVCRPRIHCQTVCETQHVLLTAFGMMSRLIFCSQATSIHSALEAWQLCTIQV